MTRATVAQQAPRASQQARGQARIEAILEAAAAIAAEGGVAMVTMHLVAKRARTSVGSMYHFFPDRESLLHTLVERHTDAVRQINRQLIAVPAEHWRALSPAATIDYLVRPFIEYIDRHPDFLTLMHGRDTAEGDADFMRAFRHALSARLPKISAAVREEYVAVLHAVAAGGMFMGFQSHPRRADLYLRELPRVLASYLAQIEEGHPLENMGCHRAGSPPELSGARSGTKDC
jgi:AcrR family transcriptional regulator